MFNCWHLVVLTKQIPLSHCSARLSTQPATWYPFLLTDNGLLEMGLICILELNVIKLNQRVTARQPERTRCLLASTLRLCRADSLTHSCSVSAPRRWQSPFYFENQTELEPQRPFHFVKFVVTNKKGWTSELLSWEHGEIYYLLVEQPSTGLCLRRKQRQ